jgi:PAS domain S-box-containing protein
MPSQDPATDAAHGAAALRFLDGGGAQAEAVRAANWTRHPLGPPDDWPAALKLSVSLCLRCALPSAVFWGPEYHIVYNDAWLTIADSDPRPLGCPGVNLVDVWPTLGPQFAQAIATGETVARDAQRLVLTRDGQPAETFWSYNGSPIQDEHGVLRGIFLQGLEVTAHVLAERALHAAKRERDFILTLVEEQRARGDPDDVMQLTVAALGKFLAVDRVGFFEVIADSVIQYGACWVSGRLPPLTGSMPSAMFGEATGAIVRAGGTLVFNAPGDPGAPPETVLDRVYTKAGVSVPLLRGGVWQGALYLSHAEPRIWTRDEIALIEEVAELCWDAVARVRAVAGLRAVNADLARDVVARTAERDRLWEVSNDLLGIATQDGRWLAVNPAWERLLGWSQDDILGRDTQWLRHPEDTGGSAAEIARIAASGTTHRLEKRLRTRDGEYRTLAWQTTLVGDRLYSNARDITEERRQQAAVRAADARTRMVLEAMEGVGVWTYDVARDRFESDIGFAKLYGFGPEEMAAGVTLADVAARVHPDDLPILREAIRHAQETGQDGAHEYRLQLADGTVRWVMARNHVQHDAAGQPEKVVGVGVDITKQRALEERLG